MRATFYRHSGRFSPGGAVLGLVGGLVASGVLAFAYAYILAYIPVVGYVTFIIAAGFGALAGFATGKLLQKGHVRNMGLAAAITAVATLAALYVSWAVWIHAIAGRADVDIPIVELATSPAVLWEVIQAVNENGAWTLKGWTPTGTILWVFWGVEALLILIPSFFALFYVLGDKAYCEGCEAWCQETVGAVQLTAADPGALRERLEASDLGVLAALPPRDGASETWTRVDLQRCPTPHCGKTNTLSVSAMSMRVGSKGEKSEHADSVVDKLLIDRPTADHIQALARRPAQQQVA